MLKSKLAIALFVALFSSVLLVNKVSAQDSEEILETTSEETVKTEESTHGGLPEQTFLMYVHEDCRHCKQVEAFVEQNQIEDQVEYVQLKNNETNMEALQDEWERFNVPVSDQGWPFMVYTNEEGEETYSIGSSPIISVLSQYNDIPYDDTVPPADDTSTGTDSSSSGDSVFLILGGVILAFIVGYGVFSALGKK